jgi:hypothetical protein
LIVADGAHGHQRLIASIGSRLRWSIPVTLDPLFFLYNK